jgi:hypothetical protein
MQSFAFVGAPSLMRQDETDNGRELGSIDLGSSAEIHGGGEKARDP